MSNLQDEVAYPLAPEGIFWTIQGEGILLGMPMIFIRLAGCPMGCPQCDTNYQLSSRIALSDLCNQVEAKANGCKWVWVTGGEPMAYDTAPLTLSLHRLGFHIAVATAGIRPVPMGNAPAVNNNGFDFVSVSPHRIDETWQQRRGDQLNVVPGLNGLKLADLINVDVSGFSHRFVTPLAGDAGSLKECLAFIREQPSWRLGIQAHKQWQLP